jgi:hypothetical protein
MFIKGKKKSYNPILNEKDEKITLIKKEKKTWVYLRRRVNPVTINT